MIEFRTPDGVQAIYDGMDEEERGKPYILRYAENGHMLSFFGSVHTGDLASPQWPVLEAEWQKFTENPNEKKVVFYEGNRTVDEGLSEEEVIRRYGESGLVFQKAKAAGIYSESPEPDRLAEVEHLKTKFEMPQIMTYYFGRQMHQWFRQDREHVQDWRAYAQDFIQHWQDYGVDLEKALDWFRQTTGKEFDAEDEETLYAVSDPYQSPVSAESGQYRDEYLLSKISEKWHEGNDIFVIYGSGHAIRLEPALEALIEGNTREE